MIVLDTHAWIWFASDPSKLGRGAARALRTASRIGVPAISLWEVSMLVARGRVSLDRDPLEWLNAALALPNVVLLPLSPAVASTSSRIATALHGDPADRLIVATAICEAAPLVTKDEKIQAFAGIVSIWN